MDFDEHSGANFVAETCLNTLVTLAVDFDDETCRETVKVNDIRCQDMLAAKFIAVELFGAQM